MLYRITRVLVVAGATSLCASLPAQTTCGIQTVAGTWAAASTGTVYATLPGSADPAPVPGAALGLVSIGFDGRFQTLLTGWGYRGKAGDLTAVGTVTVNPDCTGMLNATSPAGWKMMEQFQVLDQGNEIATIAVGGMMGVPAVWQCRWRRIAPVPLDGLTAVKNCSADMLHGTWVGVYNGVLVKSWPTAIPAGISFTGAIDYQGRLRGKFTNSVAGEVGGGEYEGAIAEVRPDCTGTWKWNFKPTSGTGFSGAGIEKFVIVNDGNEIWTMALQGPAGTPVGLGRYRKISPVPAY